VSESEQSPKGRAAGGKARAKALTPEQRSDIARKGGEARREPLRVATHGSSDRPLKIGEVDIPCYVLDDGTRVLSQRGLMAGLGMSRGSTRGGGDQMTAFSEQNYIKPFINNDLSAAIKRPIKFKAPHGGVAVFGYPATVLADICEAVLAARKAGKLSERQENLAQQCEILVRGFARVGIVALVDEATGYERDKPARDLERILQAFIAAELQPWVRTFPTDFYQEMFRLRGLDYPTATVKRPQYFGMLTNDIVYKRLAPGVLEELKRVTEKNAEGRPRYKFFQKLTSNLGYPKLREHLGGVTTMMKLSEDWPDFMQKLDRLAPKFNTTIPLPLEYKKDEDDGRGI
jgi:general stress protein YciG